MLQLEQYGQPDKQYSGMVHTINDRAASAVPFFLVQFPDGNVYIDIRINTTVSSSRVTEIELGSTVNLEGNTETGLSFKATDALVIGSLDRNQRTEEKWQHWQVIRMLARHSVIVSQPKATPDYARFSVVNLELTGTRVREVKDKPGKSYQILDFPIEAGRYRLTLQPVPDYSYLIRLLKATKQSAVTYDVLTTIPGFDDLPQVEETIDKTCLLLSLARGTYVTWINYDVFSTNGDIIYQCLRNSVTKRFGYKSLIHPDEREETQIFLATAIANLDSAEDQWQIRKAIEAYTDAKAESDFLEARALKLAICMEHIRAQFLRRHNREYILPTFNRSQKRLRRELRPLFEEQLDGASHDQLNMMLGHLSSLNRYPFRNALQELCAELTISMDDADLSKLVTIRNKLVHEFSFCSDHEQYGTPYQQYTLLEEFVGVGLLAILGYHNSGDKYTWIIPSDIEPSDRGSYRHLSPPLTSPNKPSP